MQSLSQSNSEESQNQMYKHIIDSKVFPFLFDEDSDQNSDGKEKKFINGQIITALCVLCFDDEIGQVAENVWPTHLFEKEMMKSISALGFPETNSISEEGEIEFIFKIRQNPHIPLKCSSINDQNFFYCYTIFMQKKDSTYKRGYMQKSIMIITEIYHKKLFTGLLHEFKSYYLKCLDNQIFSLERLGTLFKVFNSKEEINFQEEQKLQEEDNTIEAIIKEMNLSQIKEIKLNMELAIFPQNNNFFENLSLFYVAKIWNLWELIITETPLLVQTETPTSCSQIVLLLSSLVFPLKYCGDVRPYFTIYDNDFKDYRDNEDLRQLNSPLLGVINPICVRTLKDWPVLHFDDLYFNDNGMSNPTKLFTKEDITDEILTIPNYKRKFVLAPNKALIKTFLSYIIDEGNKSLDKLNIYLRMYLIELNNDFMRTFEEYFFLHEYNHIRRIALIKPNFSIFEIFNGEKFLKYLNSVNVYFNLKYVKDKKKTNELYSSFIKTKCFQHYLKNLLTRIKDLN